MKNQDSMRFDLREIRNLQKKSIQPSATVKIKDDR